MELNEFPEDKKTSINNRNIDDSGMLMSITIDRHEQIN